MWGVGTATGWVPCVAGDLNALDVEPDAAGVSASRASGLEVVHADLLGAAFPAGHFDVVRFSHVLEHVHSPTSVLSEAVRVVRRGGIVVILVPNHAGLIAQSFQHDEDVPRHLFAFTTTTLRRYLQKVGLEVLTLRTATPFAHSLYGMFVPPATTSLRAGDGSTQDIARVASFFSFANPARDREYRSTVAFADSLGLGATVVAVGRRRD